MTCEDWVIRQMQLGKCGDGTKDEQRKTGEQMFISELKRKGAKKQKGQGDVPSFLGSGFPDSGFPDSSAIPASSIASHRNLRRRFSLASTSTCSK
eukprot:577312-Lingulodinium_polyedra.AAC.1